MQQRIMASHQGVLRSPIRNLVLILLFMAAVVAGSTYAYMRAGWSFSDATYMVALTVYTVGYGEVHAINTPYLHAVTMGTMVLGCTGMILLTSALVQLLTIAQLREILGPNRMQNQIEKLSGHALVCGYGRIGVMLAHDLAAGGIPLVIVERNPARLAEAAAAGHLCYAGDATEEVALISAGVRRARVLATVLPDDAANVFITLSARSLCPDLEIIARGEAPTTETKLRHAGASQVVLPTHIGAERIARMILFPAPRDQKFVGTDRTKLELEALGLGMETVAIQPLSTAVGCSVQEVERRGSGSFIVASIDRDGESLPRPAPEERLRAQDRVLIVTRDPAAAARILVAPRSGIQVGRNRF